MRRRMAEDTRIRLGRVGSAENPGKCYQVRLDEIIGTARANPSAKRKRPKTKGRKRGPKQRHRPEIYFERDMFVRLLEQHWLILEPLCGRWSEDGLKLAVLPDLAMIRKHLRRWRDDPMAFQMREVAANLLERSNFLDKFLTTPSMRRVFSGNPRQVNNHFGGDPRQIANALAGVPLVSVWRSLKLCGSKERLCKVSMPESALPSYIRRKHPLLTPGTRCRSSFAIIGFLLSNLCAAKRSAHQKLEFY